MPSTDLDVAAFLLGCQKPATLEEYADLVWQFDRESGPFRPAREVWGGDPEWRHGLTIHKGPLEQCKDCESQKSNPDWLELSKYVVHPQAGETEEAAERRVRPKGHGSEYFWFASRASFLEEARHYTLHPPKTNLTGTKNENVTSQTLLLYSPTGFPQGVGRFPDDFPFSRMSSILAGAKDSREIYSGAGMGAEREPEGMKSTGIEWFRYDPLACSTLRLGGATLTSTPSEGQYVEAYVQALRDLVSAVVPSVHPDLVLCGEGGLDSGTYRDIERVTRVRDLWYIDWFNVFGPAYVETYGRDFLLGAPGFRKEELPGGYILYQVTENFGPWAASNPSPKAVEEYFSFSPRVRRVVYRPSLKKTLATDAQAKPRLLQAENSNSPPGQVGKLGGRKARGSRKGPSEQDIVRRLREMAEEAAASARRNLRIELDFSPGSIGVLDQAMDQYFNPAEPLLPTTVLSLGAYLGEAVIRNLGGRWRPSPDWQDCAVVDLGQIAELYPMRRIAKRLQEGPSASLNSWYEAAARAAQT